MTKMTFQRVTERDVGISMEEAASRLGLPSNTDPDQVRLAARMAGFPVDMIRASDKETRENMLRRLSSYAGGASNKMTLEEFRKHPGFDTFERLASESGFDTAELVNARNQNIGDYETGGFARRVGSFMDDSGLGDLITYGTIAAAGAGAATAFGGGAATTAGTGSGGASGTFAGSAPSLAPVSLPNIATAAPTTVAAGGATTGAGAAAALPASITSLEMASLPASISAITGSGAGAAAGATMQPFPEGASRIADLARSDAGSFLSRAGGWLRENPEIVGSVISGVGQGIAANQASENRLETERALIQDRLAAERELIGVRTEAERGLMRHQKDLVDENYAGANPGRNYQPLARGSSGVTPTERFKFDFSPSEGKMIRVPSGD